MSYTFLSEKEKEKEKGKKTSKKDSLDQVEPIIEESFATTDGAVIKKTTCRVNMREEPNGKIIRVLNKDDEVLVNENFGEWSRVEGKYYIMSQYLQ